MQPSLGRRSVNDRSYDGQVVNATSGLRSVTCPSPLGWPVMLGRVASGFGEEGEWLRCALHAHTTNSDGELAPDLLVRHYEWAGFDVLAITDHWIRTVERSTRKLLVIPSTELNATCGSSDDDAHVLALGVEADPEPPDSFAPLKE